VRLKQLATRLGVRIRSAREARGWSQADLAEASGLTPNYVGVLERGEKLPALETLVTVSDVLGQSLSGLLDDTRPQDAWETRASTMIRTVPTAYRRIVLAVLREATSASYGAPPDERQATAVSERPRRARKYPTRTR
jgi:transcriptional regulator with XRE-family HTH domain